LDYLPYDKRAALGIFSVDERTEQVNNGYETIEAPAAVTELPVIQTPKSESREAQSSMEVLEAMTGIKADAPLCMTCGVKMRMSGSCYVCEGCGNTSGCS
jgi:ribonucleoside-diphosphate reductase alpha chain